MGMESDLIHAYQSRLRGLSRSLLPNQERVWRYKQGQPYRLRADWPMPLQDPTQPGGQPSPAASETEVA